MKVSILEIKKVTHYLLLLLTLTYIITGIGILYFRVIEQLTFGILTKAISSRIHEYLLIPFLIILLLHIFFVIRKKKD